LRKLWRALHVQDHAILRDLLLDAVVDVAHCALR
jgi:hypothetical protein